ncbi:MAG TPA: hypothetical protein VID25_00420 [Candidatus Limnocylindrales bacterium]|jgi:cation:H+ antiporter
MPLAVFVVAAALSAASSVLLVSRLERVGERLALAEALLGLVVALAADGPEITSALTAVATGQREIGVGVALGSNAFNLAAMLGLSVLVAGGLRLPRFATVLEGTLALVIAIIAVAVVMAWIGPAPGLLLGLAAFLPYVFVCALTPSRRARLPLPRPLLTWLRRAIDEEKVTLERAPRATPVDWVVAAGAALAVIAASVVMEQSATTIGQQAGIPAIVIGGLVLAAVTSLPNAVAAVYLTLRGRGVAAMSEAFHSNAFNVLLALLVPAVIVGLGSPTGGVPLAAFAYLTLTAAAVVLALAGRGLGRPAGLVLIGGYLGYVALVVAT